MTSRLTILTAAMAITASAAAVAPKAPTAYPKAPTSDTVDTYFGIEVADPYRPLENDTAAETLAWVEAERALTESYLSQIPFRDKLRERLSECINYKKTGLPDRRKDNRYYFSENSGLDNQSILYRKATLDGEAEVFLDPNKLSDDGTVALTGTFQSNDGKYTAYTISRSGSDWTEIYLLDTETAQLLPDHIEWAKFTGVDWYGDGFFYSAYPKPDEGKEYSNANADQRIYYHRVGTPQEEDVLVYRDPEHPLHFQTAWVPDDSHYLYIFGGGQGFGNSIMLKDLEKEDAEWIVMEPTQDVIISPIGIVDDTLYFTTSEGAPRTRLMACPVTSPGRENWVELIPERPDAVMSGVQFAGKNLIVTYEKDASTRLELHAPDGSLIREIELPGLGITAVNSSQKHDEVFYSFTSYMTPWEHYSYDMATGESKRIVKAEFKAADLSGYITEEIFFPSTDGTKIHMFVTRHKDTPLDGTAPLYLYGYGGFNVSLNPYFSTSLLPFFENGGIYAVVNLRGGSEYGDEWHEAGTKLNKKNVFNDFISAAEWLIDNKYTSKERLVAEGGSNGGLLMGACLNMRPDLFAVVLPRVGVMDMMRYHLFTVGWNWAPDYGRSDDSPEMAEYLLSYSPIHNIKNDGTPYPAILVTTADHDDRVVPAHSFKYAATLQAADTGSQPKLIRIDSKAGHGAGKPVAKVLDEWADLLSFIFANLGIEPK